VGHDIGFVQCPVCMAPHSDPPVEDGVWHCLRCGEAVDAGIDDDTSRDPYDD